MIGISNKQMILLTHIGDEKIAYKQHTYAKGWNILFKFNDEKANLNAPFAERLKIST